jgi:bifunctional aspartokinase / homoserine dehydrogenase 1
LLISQSSSQNDICLVVSAPVAEQTAAALRREFAQDLAHEKVEHITLDPTVALVTVVGRNMRGSETVGRTFTALGRENVNIIAIAQGSSECNISFVVAKTDVKAALAAAHREFHLGAIERAFPVKGVAVTAPAWECEAETRTAGD